MRREPARTSGTRDELTADLQGQVEGWRHFGREDLSTQAREAADQLRDGKDEAQVGHIVYAVDDSVTRDTPRR